MKNLWKIIVALFLLSYVGVQCYRSFHSSVDLETCRSYTGYDTVDITGIAIRSEEVLTQEANGYVYYTLENGARVSKDGVIAEIYPSENDALTQKQLQEIDEEIAGLEMLQQQGAVSNTNLETLNAQISSTQIEMLANILYGKYEDLSGQKSNLMELFNRKQILTTKVADFKDQIKKLNDEKNRLIQKSPGKAKGSITSSQPGYFVSSLDGFEDIFSYDKVATLTVDEIEKGLQSKPKVIDNKNSVGKVVSNYEWYLACSIPTSKLNNIGEGMDLSVKLPFVSDESIPVEVIAINREKDKAAVILKCSYMSEELSSVRKEEIQIILNEYSGLYVSDDALQFDKDNNPGVYICTGTTLEFRRIVILHHSDTGHYSVCDPTAGQSKLTTTVTSKEESKSETSNDEDSNSDTESNEESSSEETKEIQYLKLYDDIVVGGKNLYEGKIVR